MEDLITLESGITVAEQDGKILSYVLAASWQFWSAWPLFLYMMEKLPEHFLDGEAVSVRNSYQYGPVCVDSSVRGTGVFEKVFNFSLNSMSNRFGIMVTFINKVNNRSYAAHTGKVPMKTIGRFVFNQNDYYMLACRTK